MNLNMKIKKIIENHDIIQFTDNYFLCSTAEDINSINFLKYMVFKKNLEGLNLKDNYKEMLLIEECLVGVRLYSSNYKNVDDSITKKYP